MNNPKISILIPVYLSYPFLDKINKCMLNQTYTNIEIVYINDGSPDESGAKCDQFANNDKRVKVIHKKNSGAADALNTGIENATGDYIMFIDADDWIELNTCEIAIEKALQFDTDMVFWLNIKEFQNKSIPYPPFFKQNKLFANEDIQFLRRRMIGLINDELKTPTQTDAFNAGWGKLYKASIIKNNHINWTATHLVGSSDVLFNTQLMPFINKAYYLNEYLHHYNRNNPNSLTKTYNNTLYYKYKNLFIEIEKVITNHYSQHSEFKLALNNRIALASINITLSLTASKFSYSQKKDLLTMLNDSLFVNSFNKLTIKYLPFTFKVFYFMAKYKMTWGVLLLGKIMNKLR